MSEQKRFAWPGRFGLSLWACDGDWLFQTDAIGGGVLVSADGRRVCCYCAPEAADALAQALVQRVLPRVALLRGQLPFHAAAVGSADACLLLSGLSGAGKSTLAAAMARLAGRSLLSDDASIVEAGPLQVWPAARGVSLTPDAVAGLGLNPEDGNRDPTRAAKLWYDEPPPPLRPLPLAGLVFLNRLPPGWPPQLAAIDRVEALKRVPPQLIRFDPSNRQTSGRLFEQLGEVVARTRCFRLDYPADYAALPAVVAELGHAWAPAASA